MQNTYCFDQWSGYEHLNWSFSTPASPSMTRIQLGASIAMHFWRFVEVSLRTLMDFIFRYLILSQKAMASSTTCSQWKIGNGGVEFDKIILVALYSLGGDIWQADIAVDF